MLIALALFFAAFGILVGLGRLLSYQFQVTRRINRQYQIEKTLATRSALTVIKYECTPKDPFKLALDMFPNYSNCVYVSTNTGVEFRCHISPTPYVDCQDMRVVDFWGTPPVWKTYSREPGDSFITPVFDANSQIDRVQFDVDAQSNKLYTCAIFKQAPACWLENEFGYLYRVRMLDCAVSNGFGVLRLYLLGLGPDRNTGKIEPDTYAAVRLNRPSIVMELTREDGGGGTNRAARTLSLRNGIGQLPDHHIPFLSSVENNDQISHGGGFLLSGTRIAGFGEGPNGDMYFGPRRDLNTLLDMNQFSNSWVAIEHEFSTNIVGELSVAIDFFSIREPTTYSITVHNRELAPTSLVDQVTTWVFQTKYPQPSYNESGKQYVLDTFGGEAASLRRERRGIRPALGVE
jgi:hypothetical protein